MQQTGPWDALPLPGFYLIIALIALLAVELGFRLARSRVLRSVHENEAPVGTIVGATLALLAFLLAFTFGLAASRFDARKGFVLDEANAIGTTYLRAALLPDPDRTEIRALLREYVDVRLQIIQPDKAQQALRLKESQSGYSQSCPDQHLGDALFRVGPHDDGRGLLRRIDCHAALARDSRARGDILCRATTDCGSRSPLRGLAQRKPAGDGGSQGFAPAIGTFQQRGLAAGPRNALSSQSGSPPETLYL
jgi:hypothetical protein